VTQSSRTRKGLTGTDRTELAGKRGKGRGEDQREQYLDQQLGESKKGSKSREVVKEEAEIREENTILTSNKGR